LRAHECMHAHTETQLHIRKHTHSDTYTTCVHRQCRNTHRRSLKSTGGIYHCVYVCSQSVDLCSYAYGALGSQLEVCIFACVIFCFCAWVCICVCARLRGFVHMNATPFPPNIYTGRSSSTRRPQRKAPTSSKCTTKSSARSAVSMCVCVYIFICIYICIYICIHI